MGVLKTLKDLLGLDSSRKRKRAQSRSGEARGEGGMTVEREPSTASEAAVKGTDESARPGGETDTESEPSQASAADETPAAESTRASEASQASAGDETPAAESTPESDASQASVDDETPAGEPTEMSTGEPVTAIDGIGPAYEERLREGGITSVAELAESDPDEIADASGISSTRVGRWIEDARNS